MELKVISRRQETHDCVTFLLVPTAGPLPLYAPGQFLTFLVDHYNREVRRSYSLSSSPGDPFLAVTVKRKSNGEISRYLLDEVPSGATIKSLPPSGRFTFTPGKQQRDIGFIAAGSGIAPVLPLLKQALETETRSHVWLINQNHAEEDVIFGDQLQKLKEDHQERFTLVSFLSTPHAHQIMPQRLNNGNLEQLVRQLTRHLAKDAVVYCCGPEALMRMARFTLRVIGFSGEQFRQEHFTIDPPPRPPLLSDSGKKHILLRTKEGIREFNVAFPTNILQAALDNQIALPYSCRGGRCSTCALRCTRGKVVMSINDVLTEKDLDEGWVLTCTGYAASDLELEA